MIKTFATPLHIGIAAFFIDFFATSFFRPIGLSDIQRISIASITIFITALITHLIFDKKGDGFVSNNRMKELAFMMTIVAILMTPIFKTIPESDILDRIINDVSVAVVSLFVAEKVVGGAQRV